MMEPEQTQQEVIKDKWTKLLPWGVCFHLFCHKTGWTIFWRVIVATKTDKSEHKLLQVLPQKEIAQLTALTKRFSAKSMSCYTRWL